MRALLVKTRKVVERQAVQWINGIGKTGSSGVGNEDLGVKLGGDGLVAERGAPWLDVQDLELEQRPASQELVQETQVAVPEHEELAQEALSEHEQEMQGLLSDSKETKKASPDPKVQTKKITS